MLITVQSSKRFFYIYFLLTFLLLVISYLSLWVPIYNHTSRVAMLTLPIVGLYLFDQTLLKNDRILLRESTSLHIWNLACLLYLGFMFFCYVLAFYSLARVKRLVEKADIGYLGYMLKCAKLVQDENEFPGQLANLEPSRKLSVKTIDQPPIKAPSLPRVAGAEQPLADLNKIGRELKSNPNIAGGPQETVKKPSKTEVAVAKTDSLTKMELLTDLELSTMKPKNLSSKTSLPFKVSSASKTNLVFKSDTMAKTDILSKNSGILNKSGILSKDKAIKLASKSTEATAKNKIQNFESLPLKSLKVQKSETAQLNLVKSQKSSENKLKLVKPQKSDENRLKLMRKSDENRLKLLKLQKSDESKLKLLKLQKSNENVLMEPQKREENKLMPEEHRLMPMKSFYSIKPVEPVKDRSGFDLQKELEDLKKDLMLARTLDKSSADKQKKKTVQFLNEILGLKSQPKGYYRRKKIVSRFISSSKLKTIEFISLIPSDEYARIALPVSFFLFFYFYSLHFIF